MEPRGPMFLDDKHVAGAGLHLAGRLGSPIELALLSVFLEAHGRDRSGGVESSVLYNTPVGKLKIKKKDVVVPFRQTLAYRFTLIIGSIGLFFLALWNLFRSFEANDTLTLISGALLTAAGGYLVFYNFDQLRTVKISTQTLRKMRRR